MKFIAEKTSTLLETLGEFMDNTSRTKLRKMLTAGRIQVDGVVEHKAKSEITKGMVIELLSRVKAHEITPPPLIKQKKIDLNILWEDEAILVVEKPEGLLSIATDKRETDTLHGRCVDYVRRKDENNWCYIVHRLDRDTSGIMVFALHSNHKEYLQAQFAARAVHRTYHALIEGRPKVMQGVAREWLVEDKNLFVKRVKSTFHGSKEAITNWEVADTDNHTSLIQITIETGRRHQIRMAMRSLGCPVVGDELHGAESNTFGRVCLHASALEFLHPETDEPVRFESKIPFYKSKPRPIDSETS